MLLLDRYRIEGMLGEGGLGSVYKAFDTRLKRLVAIKTLKASLAASHADTFRALQERFAREAEAGARMGVHPNVVAVHDLATDADGTQYLIQEFVAGGTLAERIARGPLPLPDALRITADVARALQAAHDKTLVHRDIKPANIFVTEEGRALVGDWGICQMDDVSGRTRAATGHPGTPLYMSPEQERMTAYLRPTPDQYSLGLVLFEMLTGQMYKRVGERQAATLLASQSERVIALVERMIEEHPDDRFPAMAEVQRGAERIARELAAQTTKSPTARMADGSQPHAPTPGHDDVEGTTHHRTSVIPPRPGGYAGRDAARIPPPMPIPQGRQRALVIGLVAVLLATVLGGGFVFSRSGGTGASAMATRVAAAATAVPSPLATSPVAVLPIIAATPTNAPSPATQATAVLSTPLPTPTPLAAATDTPTPKIAATAIPAPTPAPPPSSPSGGTPSGSVDLSQAAVAALPQGTTVKSISSIDLAGDGQVQALVVGEETPIRAGYGTNDIAALVSWQSNRWNVIYRTQYESVNNYLAAIDGYAKTNAHPGFVVIASGSHGNSGSLNGFVVFRCRAYAFSLKGIPSKASAACGLPL